MLQANWFRSKWLATGWFIIMCILFFLPGSALPKENSWMTIIHIDKLVHVGLFAVLLFLCRSSFSWSIDHYNVFLLLLALFYGFSVEIIQREWVPGRSFDLFDVAADMTGSIAGILVWLWAYKK